MEHLFSPAVLSRTLQARNDANYTQTAPGWVLWGSNNLTKWTYLEGQTNIAWISSGQKMVSRLEVWREHGGLW